MALGVLALFVMSFVAILFVIYQLLVGASSTRPSTRPAPTAIAIPPTAARFDSLLGLFQAPPRAGQSFVVTLTESELNSRLASGLARQPDVPFRDVTARVLDDRIDFTGKARVAGLDVQSTVAMRPYAQSGRVAYDLESIDFGPVPVPGPARSAIQEAIDRQMANQRITEGMLIDAIQARRGTVVIVGRIR